MRRTTLIAPLAITAALALALTACGRSDGETPASDASATPGEQTTAIADGPATGTIEVWAMGSEGEVLPDLLESFKSENPDVTVNVTAIPWEEAANKIQTAIAGGTTPDLSMVGTDFLPTYVATGGLAPVPEGLVEPDGFYGGAWQGSVVDGTAYAVPWYVETRVLFYRKDLAAAAGWDHAPTTWQELRQFAEDLQGAGATWGLALPVGQANSWQGTLPFFWQAGGSVATDDHSAFELDSDAMTGALTYIDEMFRAGVANPDLPTEFGAIEPLFVDGTYGAFYSGPWEIGLLRSVAGDEFLQNSVGVAVLPEGPAGLTTSYLGGGSWSVFTDAKNSDGAWKLLRWLTQPETQQKWFDISTDLPAVKSAWDYAPLSEDPFVSVFGDQLQSASTPPLIQTWIEVGATLDTITEQLARGQIGPEDAAAQMQSEAQAIGLGD